MGQGGLVGHREVTDGLLGNIQDLEKYIFAQTQEIALKATIAGLAAAQETIDKTPSSLSPGKPNRNWTFHMRQSLDSDIKRTGNTITMRVGWLNIQEAYFLAQEDGATLPNGVEITPMHALMNAYTEMTKELTRSGVKLT